MTKTILTFNNLIMNPLNTRRIYNYAKKMIIDELIKFFPDCRIRKVQKNEDPRNYRVSFEKIKRELGFTISKTVPEGIKEVKEAIELGIIQNPEDQKYYNIPHTI